jgi:hypothetical protein
MFTSIVSDQ